MTIQKFEYSIDLLQTILWQDNESIALQSLIQQKQDWYNQNQTEFWDYFYNKIFNLLTADKFGLVVWAIILNLPLQIGQSPIIKLNNWGFGPLRKNFNNGNFVPDGGGYNFTLEELRTILRLRYFQLTTRGGLIEANIFVKEVFKEYGEVYILDNYRMEIRVIFRYYPTQRMIFILKNYDLIPRPAAVAISYETSMGKRWGFGPLRKNFNNGNFYNGVLKDG